MGISRRGLLIGTGVFGVAGLLAVADTAPMRRKLGWTGPDGVVPDVPPAPVAQSRHQSAARGREVDVVVIGDRAAPVCLVLHGRGGSAQGMVELGLPQFLAASGLRLVLVAVDGGDEYWTGPSMTMLTSELPMWLSDLGLARPRVALGISMGGFGALALAARQDLDAVAAASPALFPTWADAEAVHGFPDERTWQDHEPLRHTIAARTAVGVWCGQEDPFHDAAVTFAAQADATSFDHGAHDAGYWKRVLPHALRFVGDRAR
jgi:hypothetical protein